MKFHLLPFSWILITFLSCHLSAQQINKYGLNPLQDLDKYHTIIVSNPEFELVDLEILIPDLQLDIRYATVNNFVHKAVYNSPKAYSRLPVAKALKNVQADLNKSGLELKIYDAYRPYSVTVKFYELYPDTTYVASPYSGSRHNRGAAVDLTIIDTLTQKELNMGTEYDDFREIAHPTYKNLPDSVLANREFLISLMKKHGFTVYPSEWWHFDYKGWERFELMDLSFEELGQ